MNVTRRQFIGLTASVAATAALSGSLGQPVSIAESSVPGENVYLDKYGGHPGKTFAATGFFGINQDSDERWWMRTPLGNAYYAMALSYTNTLGYVAKNGVDNPYQTLLKSKYGTPIDESAWSVDALDRMRSWGFNSIGPYASTALNGKMPYMVDISTLRRLRDSLNPSGDRLNDTYPIMYEDSQHDDDYRRYFFDVFHPTFKPGVEASVASQIATGNWLDDPMLIGYLVDNEVPLWKGRSKVPGSPWATGNTLADVFIGLPSSAAGKMAWISDLQAKYITITALNAAWGSNYADFSVLSNVATLGNTPAALASDKSVFLKRIYATYFRIIRDAIRAVDTNHLFMGTRLIVRNVQNPAELFEEIAFWVDAVSINYYIFTDLTKAEMSTEMNDFIFNPSYKGKPFLITEYSFAGSDSGMPGTQPNGAILPTQEERARITTDFRRISAASLYVVGDLWWNYIDPPVTGGQHGNEDSNIGLVDNSDRPYLRFLLPFARESASIYSQRGLASHSNAIFGINSYRSFVSLSPRGTSMTTTGLDIPGTLIKGSVAPGMSIVQSSNGDFSFSYSLKQAITSAKLEIYDGSLSSASAMLKRTIARQAQSAGRQTITWDGRDSTNAAVATGTYYYVFKVVGAETESYYAFDSFIV